VALGGSQSTVVPENGAYILAEDQNGVGASFGSSKNYFDFDSGKNTIATTSENFVPALGNFSTAEQDSLVSQHVPGVCISSGGCNNLGSQTSFFPYKVYPVSGGDLFNGTGASSIGEFGGPASGRSVSTATPACYWLRSSTGVSYEAGAVVPGTGAMAAKAVYDQCGFRPAGVFHLKALNVCSPQTFRLGNCLNWKMLTNEGFTGGTHDERAVIQGNCCF
jgi:hypothetical protein